MPRAALALALLALLTACTRQPSSGPSVVMHSVLLNTDLPGALPPGPDQAAYQRRLEQQAARHGLACTGTPEVMLSHAPDVLVDDLQVASGALWLPVGARSGVWTVRAAPPLLVAQAGSAVMVCVLAARVVG
ncbi:hypothetical protein D3875_04215 [Deinococcus cavernae]|uniref:Lipoprotein n=1 Tax=Deinococcus cavernae TaxID=2320857 RepID=A0A418VEF7_9DEIO|nr:hypothetical protein [Deinococcus cavernae]RJF74492.1 hypothetical protein D3875_04215 [Deinococcus cavernae]